MTLTHTGTQTLPETIANLELDDIGCKLLADDAFEADRRGGERLWDEERVARALSEYRQFLALMSAHPDAMLIPSEDIDDVWHTHVLHTARYRNDCELIFGSFQDHQPASSETDELQDAEHCSDLDETLRLFAETFGQIPQSYSSLTERRCGRTTIERRCGRVTVERRCGRATERRCGRAAAERRCGRTAPARRCGRSTADRRCGRVTLERRCGRISCPGSR